MLDPTEDDGKCRAVGELYTCVVTLEISRVVRREVVTGVHLRMDGEGE